MKLTKKFLRERALDALKIAADGVRENSCDVVSNEFLHRLETDFECDLPDASYASVDGRKHFVAAIPAEYCSFTGDDGFVIVDATIKQFEDGLEESFPDVAILPPNDPRRKEWYDVIKTRR